MLDQPVDGAILKMKRHQIAKSGQVILSEIWGKKGAVGIVPPEGEGALCTSHFFLFDVKPCRIDPAYLRVILEANYLQPQLEERAKGSTGYAAVRPEYLLSADIPLPPLEKQRRIAALADYFGRKIEEITKLIAQDKKESEVLLGRISSRIYDNLAKKYGTQELVEISQQITDGTHQTPIYVEKGVPFISVKDITTGKISFSDAKYVTEATHKKLVKRAKPEKGDILLTKVGTTGYAKMIDVNLEFSIFVSLCLIKLQKEIVLPKYVDSTF